MGQFLPRRAQPRFDIFEHRAASLCGGGPAEKRNSPPAESSKLFRVWLFNPVSSGIN
jgi:hypothetical protein